MRKTHPSGAAIDYPSSDGRPMADGVHDAHYKRLFAFPRMVEDLLYRELARNEAPGPRGERPAVLAVVLYNGTGRWTAAVEVTELLGPVEASLAPYQPSQRYLVVDEQHLEADDLPSHNLMTAVVRLEQSRSLADLVGVLEVLREWRRAGDDELMQVFADWGRRLMEKFMPTGAPALAPGLTLEEVAMTLEERVSQWPEQWMQEGREQGLAQGLVQGRGEGLERGREQGLAQGREQGLEQGLVQGRGEGLEQGLEQGRDEGLEHERALLRRMTAARFGEAAAERVSGMLARIADPERLAEAGEWLVRCDTAQAFLDRVHALPADPSPRND